MTDRLDPYCGPAPAPAELWASWNFDPLLVPLVAATLFFAFSLSRIPDMRDSTGLSNAGALALLLIAFVTPICALTTALFSARVFHHVLLVAGVAPLLALAFPAGGRLMRVPVSVLFLAHTLAFWVWHAPAPYIFALGSDLAYWLMQGTLLTTAIALWQRLLSPDTHPGVALAGLLGSVIQMGMLGALLTFAGRPLYEPHFTTTLPYGLTPLADQQLSGLIMWVPGALPYFLAALLIGYRALAEDRRADNAGVGR